MSEPAVKDGRKPCRTCGETSVEVHIGGAIKDGHESVISLCVGCGNRRGCYERKATRA